MFTINGHKITLTRGDTLRVQVGIAYAADDCTTPEPYTPVEGDTVRFALKHSTMVKDKLGFSEFKDELPLVTKDIPIDTMILQLDPDDTKQLSFGAYKYDIELTMADGFVCTFIADADFIVTEEVH